ncbi:MAG: MarR family transcriptional regulator [Balneolaceae bacterium]|jgi:DNA-binding MarR family transcriptional regulator
MEQDRSSVLKDNLFFLASAFSRKLNGEADEIFSTMGIASSHALILLLINEEPGIQPSTLADKLFLKPSTITRLVQKLERKEMVERKTEGRATSIHCTPRGLELATNIEGSWQSLLDEKRKQLGERYVEVLSEMIANALGNI